MQFGKSTKQELLFNILHLYAHVYQRKNIIHQSICIHIIHTFDYELMHLRHGIKKFSCISKDAIVEFRSRHSEILYTGKFVEYIAR